MTPMARSRGALFRRARPARAPTTMAPAAVRKTSPARLPPPIDMPFSAIQKANAVTSSASTPAQRIDSRCVQPRSMRARTLPWRDPVGKTPVLESAGGHARLAEIAPRASLGDGVLQPLLWKHIRCVDDLTQ